MRPSLIPITHVRFFFQLYEIDDNPARREFLDELFAFMQKRGESRFVLLSQPSLPPLPLSLSLSLVLSQQGLVWVSRLGWPRTKISQTRFFSESISKLIIWRAGGGPGHVLAGGQMKRRLGQTGAQSFSSDRGSAHIGPLFVPR